MKPCTHARRRSRLQQRGSSTTSTLYWSETSPSQRLQLSLGSFAGPNGPFIAYPGNLPEVSHFAGLAVCAGSKFMLTCGYSNEFEARSLI